MVPPVEKISCKSCSHLWGLRWRSGARGAHVTPLGDCYLQGSDSVLLGVFNGNIEQSSSQSVNSIGYWCGFIGVATISHRMPNGPNFLLLVFRLLGELIDKSDVLLIITGQVPSCYPHYSDEPIKVGLKLFQAICEAYKGNPACGLGA